MLPVVHVKIITVIVGRQQMLITAHVIVVINVVLVCLGVRLVAGSALGVRLRLAFLAVLALGLVVGLDNRVQRMNVLDGVVAVAIDVARRVLLLHRSITVGIVLLEVADVDFDRLGVLGTGQQRGKVV